MPTINAAVIIVAGLAIAVILAWYLGLIGSTGPAGPPEGGVAPLPPACAAPPCP